MNYGFQDKAYCYFVMEYAEGGDAYSFVSNLKHPSKVKMFKALGEEGVRFMFAGVVLGLECLHKHNLMYRDLKL